MDSSDISCIDTIEDLCSDTTQPCSNLWECSTFYFSAMVYPMTDLVDVTTGRQAVQFEMRRNNRVVTLQWGEFTGNLSRSGAASINVTQTINYTPYSKVTTPIFIEYKDEGRITHAELDPHPAAGTGNLSFYLTTSGSGTSTENHDFVRINGGNIQWIVAPE